MGEIVVGSRHTVKAVESGERHESEHQAHDARLYGSDRVGWWRLDGLDGLDVRSVGWTKNIDPGDTRLLFNSQILCIREYSEYNCTPSLRVLRSTLQVPYK